MTKKEKANMALGRTIDTEEGFTGRGHGNGDNLI